MKAKKRVNKRVVLMWRRRILADRLLQRAGKAPRWQNTKEFTQWASENLHALFQSGMIEKVIEPLNKRYFARERKRYGW